MKCFHCGEEITNEAKMAILNIDGDIACDTKCELNYNKQKEYFLSIILPNDEFYNYSYLGESRLQQNMRKN